MRVKLTVVGISQHPRTGMWMVEGADAQGRAYTHTQAFKYRQGADILMLRIERAGLIINDEHWDMRVPYGTNAWLIDGYEAKQIQDEKDGLG